MPSYEPTPKRFSVLSVSRSASRRNSIDDPSHPSLATGPPPTPSYSSPTDLANALKRLQHAPDTTETEERHERGRSRQSVGERAIKSTWGHDEPIRIPAARRESSASTRDRIAMWEERSRSQSKGRSKSRGRDIGAGSRISVVPEVPELAAALAQLGQKGRVSAEENTPEDALNALEGKPPAQKEAATETSADEPQRDERQDEKPPSYLNSVEGQELMEDPWRTDPPESKGGSQHTSPNSSNSRSGTLRSWMEAEVIDDTDIIEVNTEEEAQDPEPKAADPRPRTPVRVSPEQLPTPQTTPQSTRQNPDDKQSHDSAGSDGISPPRGAGAKTPTPPSTPVREDVGPALPLTPDATPAPKRLRSPIKMTFGETLVPGSPQDIAQTEFPQSPPIEPTYRHIDTGKTKDHSDDEREDLPAASQNESEAEPVCSRDKWPSQRPGQELHPRPDNDGRYHNVWRIQDYEPDFKMPAQRIARLDADMRADFSGYPLQELPKSQRSQLSAEAEMFKPVERETADPYPHTTKPRPVEPYAVDIPPSPTTTYVPGVPPRAPRQRSRSRQGPREAARYTARNRGGKHEWDAPPVIERALHAASVSVIQGLTVPVELYRGLRDIYYPPPSRPDIVKAYPVRRRLPVRIFFPSHHDLTSPTLLPTLFTLHGGAFTVGSAADDDAWNRAFSDAYTVLVIALNYSKAPWAVFPGPLLDAEALYHAVLNDESLPIDRMRTALCGFDAGANLALGLAQLPSVKTGYDPSRHAGHEREYDMNPYPHAPPRSHPPPAAVISVCGILDFEMSATRKARTRPYKRQLRGPRGWGPGLDWMARLLPSSAWSYIPYGHDISDPLLSPAYASRGELPPHVFVVAAELDCLAHESWRTACAWGGRAIPDPDVLVGRRGPSRWRGCLDDGTGENAAKFGWGETHTNALGVVEGTTRWLLVPDVVHGFDSAAWRNKYLWGDEEARMDSEMKTIAYQRELAEWLWGTVWR